MDNIMLCKRQNRTGKPIHSVSKWIGRLVTWIGLIIVGILAIPAGVLYLLVFATRSLVDWIVSLLNKNRKDIL